MYIVCCLRVLNSKTNKFLENKIPLLICLSYTTAVSYL